jgi:hypothetical protein
MQFAHYHEAAAHAYEMMRSGADADALREAVDTVLELAVDDLTRTYWTKIKEAVAEGRTSLRTKDI